MTLAKKKNRRVALAVSSVLAGGALLLLGGRANAQEPTADGRSLKRKKRKYSPEEDLPTPPKPGTGGGGTLPADPLGPGDGPSRTNPSDDDDDDPARKNPADGPTPSRRNPSSGDDDDDYDPIRVNPKPSGPDPKWKDLPRFFNPDWPDPGKFYPVASGDFQYRIARRWLNSSLFLAAKNAGGLSDEEALDWAAARGPSGNFGGPQDREAWDFILCSAINDMAYGSFRVGASNRRGPHGRGIDFNPQHADNWGRLSRRLPMRRNVRLHQAGESGTPRNAGQGDRAFPVLWMARLDDETLYRSDGRVLKAAGPWADGNNFSFPPPVVMRAGVDDATGGADLEVWGCGDETDG